jgi:hypothetical protein
MQNSVKLSNFREYRYQQYLNGYTLWYCVETGNKLEMPPCVTAEDFQKCAEVIKNCTPTPRHIVSVDGDYLWIEHAPSERWYRVYCPNGMPDEEVVEDFVRNQRHLNNSFNISAQDIFGLYCSTMPTWKYSRKSIL